MLICFPIICGDHARLTSVQFTSTSTSSSSKMDMTLTVSLVATADSSSCGMYTCVCYIILCVYMCVCVCVCVCVCAYVVCAYGIRVFQLYVYPYYPSIPDTYHLYSLVRLRQCHFHWRNRLTLPVIIAIAHQQHIRSLSLTARLT